MNYSLDEWFASLTVAQKERIASKIAKRDIVYPECTKVWIEIDDDRKKRIHNHCTNDHGLIKEAWSEGDTFSY